MPSIRGDLSAALFFSTMPRVALVTSSKYPDLTDDDRLLLRPLAERGINAEATIWDDPACDWPSFDAVILRSCWDYHLNYEEFLRWIALLEQAKTPVWNSAPLVRWNASKSYLRDLEANGISIVPTYWPEAGDGVRLREKLHELGWMKAVVKPRVSATAHRTQLIAADDADSVQELFGELQRGPGAMVQKFMHGVVTEGEWSVIFLGGKYSHAVLKMAKAGDFRVQSDFGGTDRAAEPPAHVLQSAIHIVQTVEPTLYARVDGVVDDGQFRLMELELIEPALFLASHPAAPSGFADAIAATVYPRSRRVADR
jgi:glutathione synthase/RimK-type ligase-like ATP-grasp enzyme